MQLEIFTGRELRDEGIKRAVDHADREIPDWSSQAYDLLKEFLLIHSGSFMAEDFREYCEGKLEEPPSKRAFGHVILKAAREGLIHKVGIGQVKNKTAHCANAAVWGVRLKSDNLC